MFQYFFHITKIIPKIIPKMRIITDLFLVFAQDHSTKIYGPLLFIRYFTRPFNQKLRSSLIFFFHEHTTIRPKYVVFLYFLVLFCGAIRPNLGYSLNFFLHAHNHFIKSCNLLPLIITFVHEHSTKKN